MSSDNVSAKVRGFGGLGWSVGCFETPVSVCDFDKLDCRLTSVVLYLASCNLITIAEKDAGPREKAVTSDANQGLQLRIW